MMNNRLNSKLYPNYIAPSSVMPCMDITPCSTPYTETRTKYRYMNNYALSHRYDFKGFWVAPFVILQKNTDTSIIEYTVSLIPEVECLLELDWTPAPMDIYRVMRLIQYGAYKLKRLGCIRVNDFVLEPIDIPDEYKANALNAFKNIGQQYGLNFRTMEELD